MLTCAQTRHCCLLRPHSFSSFPLSAFDTATPYTAMPVGTLFDGFFAKQLTLCRLHAIVHRNFSSNLMRRDGPQQARRFGFKPNSHCKDSSRITNLFTRNVKSRSAILAAGRQWVGPLLEPLRAYGRMQQRNPYLTQFSTTVIIYFLGDISAQGFGSKGFTTKEYEPIRGVRAMIIGGIWSIPGYEWFLWLGRNFNYSSWARTVGTKILISQAVFAPTINTYFFSMQTLLAGGSLADVKRRVMDTVPVSWKNLGSSGLRSWLLLSRMCRHSIVVHLRALLQLDGRRICHGLTRRRRRRR